MKASLVADSFGFKTPQVNDIAFRRHVLVQALILLDFILSLTAQARQRLLKLIQPGKAVNKAVLYQFTISDEDVGRMSFCSFGACR